MKLIILTQYFPHETGAPQNRLFSLAKNIVRQGHTVEVLTAMPNYPKSEIFEEYRGKKFHCEELEGIKTYRSWIYVSKKTGIARRLLNYFSFVLSSVRLAKKCGPADYILVESPPLFLSWSAFHIAKIKKAKVIFNVSDLWPESAEQLGIVTNRLFLRWAYQLESWSYKKAFLVTGQTKGICENISSRFPTIKPLWVPNGVDIDVYNSVVEDQEWKQTLGLSGKKVFMYAGIIGHAQHLETIVEAANILKERNDIKLVMVGDGPVKQNLIEYNTTLNAGVIFLPNTPKMKVLGMIASCYGFIVPLKKLDLFKGAIPSKIFDPLALGVPICLGVEGEAQHIFIDEGKSGLFFEPENANALAETIRILANDSDLKNKMGTNGREFVYRRFNRAEIASSLISKINQLT